MPEQAVIETLKCIDCAVPFTLQVREREFYKQKGYKFPKRCRECRLKKKERMALPDIIDSLEKIKKRALDDNESYYMQEDELAQHITDVISSLKEYQAQNCGKTNSAQT